MSFEKQTLRSQGYASKMPCTTAASCTMESCWPSH